MSGAGKRAAYDLWASVDARVVFCAARGSRVAEPPAREERRGVAHLNRWAPIRRETALQGRAGDRGTACFWLDGLAIRIIRDMLAEPFERAVAIVPATPDSKSLLYVAHAPQTESPAVCS